MRSGQRNCLRKRNICDMMKKNGGYIWNSFISLQTNALPVAVVPLFARKAALKSACLTRLTKVSVYFAAHASTSALREPSKNVKRHRSKLRHLFLSALPFHLIQILNQCAPVYPLNHSAGIAVAGYVAFIICFYKCVQLIVGYISRFFDGRCDPVHQNTYISIHFSPLPTDIMTREKSEICRRYSHFSNFYTKTRRSFLRRVSIL